MHHDPADLRRLSHAVLLADAGHFGRAAAAASLSQPAFSRSVQALERRFGCPLFERSRGRVVPTPFGRVVVDRARRLLHEADELEREVALLKGGDVGAVSVAAGTYAADLCVPAALRRLLASHPALSVRVRVRDWRDLAADVESEAADVGLGEISEIAGRDALETELLGRHEILFVCRPGHPLLTRRRPTLHDLVAFPFAGVAWPPRGAAMLPKGSLAAGTVDAATGRFLPSVTVDRAGDVRDLVRGTDVLTILTRSQCADELEAGRLAVVPFHPPWARTRYGLLWRRGRTRAPASVAFAEAVRAAEAEVAAREATLALRWPSRT